MWMDSCRSYDVGGGGDCVFRTVAHQIMSSDEDSDFAPVDEWDGERRKILLPRACPTHALTNHAFALQI